ncbi:MAG: sulfur carrier protein ThiS [Thermodesulfovibrionales bacterium]|nr:sulfur carrier protein ThiS [Thermodesulfovibrionales bacterium]
MKIKLNGQDYNTEKETLLELLSELGIMPERVAVELNLCVIRRADLAKQKIQDGDVVEIINFVGGGI